MMSMAHNFALGLIMHLSIWTISTIVIWEISFKSLSSFSFRSSEIFATFICINVSALPSLSMPSRSSSIELKASSKELVIFLAYCLPSAILCSHSFNRMFPLVCSEIVNLGALSKTLLFVAITASWNVTRAALASLSLADKFSETWLTSRQLSRIDSTLASKFHCVTETLLRISITWNLNIPMFIILFSMISILACSCSIKSLCWLTYI
jgi:hypothetical protein